MSAVSGQFGTIHIGGSELVECVGWTFERSVAEHAYASCSTDGSKKRVAGTKDANGTFQSKYDPDDPLEDHLDEGDAVTLLLYVTATKRYTVPAIILSISMEVDLDEGSIIGYDVSWGLNGAYSHNL